MLDVDRFSHRISDVRHTKEALTLAAQTQDDWERELFERRRHRNLRF
jgi:hypothetical protein